MQITNKKLELWRQKTPCVSKHVEKENLSYTAYRDVNWHNHFEKLFGSVC